MMPGLVLDVKPDGVHVRRTHRKSAVAFLPSRPGSRFLAASAMNSILASARPQPPQFGRAAEVICEHGFPSHRPPAHRNGGSGPRQRHKPTVSGVRRWLGGVPWRKDDVEQGRGVGVAHVPSLRDSRAFSHADPALTCWATIVTPFGLCLEPAQILKNGDL